MKTTIIAVAATLAAATASPVVAAEDGVVTLSAKAAAAAPKPTLNQSRPCGTEADQSLCVRILAGDFEPKTLPDYRVRFAAPGRAMVTWQGNVGCSYKSRTFYGNGFSQSVYEYYVHLALKNDASAFVGGAPGSTTVGAKEDLLNGQSNVPPPSVRQIVYLPVTLSRVFNVAAGVQTYRVLVVPDLRQYEDISCSITGGTTIVQYTPN
ncbi:hypothetical protein [Methylopila sp. Yamaguchi]|uniref:hypothetical protein n=1 Tax=Methylopila sp. Yamaguchi TaxID=1437817 RepID=UPI000CB0933B|nr:hypothetical protein [Methylopila sp. Yamaguchi]GBD50223.1 hypothetical protein METY_3436 [Methylopila sp. Yamaguchi]